MEVIILAGGFGTRLSHIVEDVPKPMAPVSGVPFLVYVLENLLRAKITKVIMATGFKSERIEEYFGDNYKGMDIIYSIEIEPLGTGGAIKKALGCCTENNICVLNGDTYFDINLSDMQKFHNNENTELTIGLKKMYDFDRYGTVEIQNNNILKFNEKKQTGDGYINGGVYMLKKEIFDGIKENKFSFEADYMEKFVSVKKFKGYISNGYFIDIGIPEDYQRAGEELKI